MDMDGKTIKTREPKIALTQYIASDVEATIPSSISKLSYTEIRRERKGEDWLVL